MDLLSYFRVLRRRWVLIVVCVIIGAGLGVATTLFDTEAAKERTYYKATNTQIYDNSQSGPVPSVVSNIDQVAVLVTTGDVPNAVAKAIGSDETGRQLAEKIVTTTNSVTTTVDITATDASAKRAVALADEFAKQIEASLVARDTARYNTSREDVQKQLDALKAQANGFLAQLAQVPRVPDFDTIQRQYDATQNQYYSVYGQLQSLTSAGAPGSKLSTLEDAQAVPIPEAEYLARLNLGALGQNHLQAGNQNNASTANPLAVAQSPSLLEGRTARGVLGALLGLFVGIGLAIVADRLDRRIRSRAEAEEAFGLPVLAEIPNFTRSQSRNRELVAHTRPQSRAADAFRAIKTSLLFQQSAGDTRNTRGMAPVEGLFEAEAHDCVVIMVTSASPREGKTTTSANLAAVFAEAGEEVLVVNCDFRRPTIHQQFGVEDLPRSVQSTSVPNVKIVTNVLADPSANPAQIVAAQRQVVGAARERFTVIILDTAPMLAANDAIETVAVADLVVLIARASITTIESATRSMEILTRLGAPLAGVVLVATDQAASDYYYYYQRDRLSRRERPAAASTNGNGAAPDPSTNGAPAASDPVSEAPQF
jgi:Mrp family chromosome partitioning ATPase/capsular polysaccharide biosynthesis protein